MSLQSKHLYNSDDKLKWFGYGEWIEEPDYAEFEHRGLKCKVVRVVKMESSGHAFGGHFCGYVRTPHEGFLELKEEPHGGITYRKQEMDGFWIGFDCAHSGDLIPSMNFLNKTDENLKKFQALKAELMSKCSEELLWIFKEHYKNFNYVCEETKLLAEQIYNHDAADSAP